MKKIRFPWRSAAYCGALACLILDSRCASQAAADALRQCAYTVIPSLFPMLVVTNLMLPAIVRLRLPKLSRLCRIPQGSEGIFLLGLVGGFPVGAQCIAQTPMERSDARRMLGFCNNCGPAFVFGMIGSFFSDPMVPVILLLIQTFSALTIAMFWSGTPGSAVPAHIPKTTLPDGIHRAAAAVTSICAWVILGNVVLSFVRRWLFPFMPQWAALTLTGVVELTNGCMQLSCIPWEGLRFVAAEGFMCFGGGCVLLQIQSMAEPAGIPMHPCLAQKLCQTMVGISLACVYLKTGFAGLLCAAVTTFGVKIAVEKKSKLMYNNSRKGGNTYAVSQTN